MGGFTCVELVKHSLDDSERELLFCGNVIKEKADVDEDGDEGDNGSDDDEVEEEEEDEDNGIESLEDLS